MNKKSNGIVKKLCFTLVVVISIISIIGCPNTVSSKANGTDENPNPPPQSPKITLTGGNHGNVKIRLNDGSWGALNEFHFDLLKEDDEITFRVENPDAGYGLVFPEVFQWDKTKPNEATLKNSDNKYKNGINLSFKKVEDYLRFEEGDPVVTDYRGLGFGKKDGKLCLSYGEVGDLKGTPMLLSDAKQDIENEIGIWADYPTEDSYSNIKDGLEKRWFATYKTINSKGGSVKWLKSSTDGVSGLNDYISNVLDMPAGKLKIKEAFDFAGCGAYFAVNKNKDIFVRASPTGPIWFAADWHVVFVEKVESPKMYSFHYGPYTLRNAGGKYPLVPDDENNNSVDNHMFTLSGMLRDYLRKNGVFFLGDIKDFDLIKNKDNYDIYIVIGECYRTESATFFCYDFVFCSFRNVLKLNGDAYTNIWGDCWTKDETGGS